MPFNYSIKIRFKKDQIERIKQDSRKQGFRYMAEYIRWIILEKNTETEEKINLIYAILKRNDERKK
jgi:predicted DNA binding CopG/RHH family protein